MKKYQICIMVVIALSGCNANDKHLTPDINEANSEGVISAHIFKAIQRDYHKENHRFTISFEEMNYHVWKGKTSFKSADYHYGLLSSKTSNWTSMMVISIKPYRLSYIGAVIKEPSPKLEFISFTCVGLLDNINDAKLAELSKATKSSIPLQQCPPKFTLKNKVKSVL